jgi:hypothetical protein
MGDTAARLAPATREQRIALDELQKLFQNEPRFQTHIYTLLLSLIANLLPRIPYASLPIVDRLLNFITESLSLPYDDEDKNNILNYVFMGCLLIPMLAHYLPKLPTFSYDYTGYHNIDPFDIKLTYGEAADRINQLRKLLEDIPKVHTYFERLFVYAPPLICIGAKAWGENLNDQSTFSLFKMNLLSHEARVRMLEGRNRAEQLQQRINNTIGDIYKKWLDILNKNTDLFAWSLVRNENSFFLEWKAESGDFTNNDLIKFREWIIQLCTKHKLTYGAANDNSVPPLIHCKNASDIEKVILLQNELIEKWAERQYSIQQNQKNIKAHNPPAVTIKSEAELRQEREKAEESRKKSEELRKKEEQERAVREAECKRIEAEEKEQRNLLKQQKDQEASLAAEKAQQKYRQQVEDEKRKQRSKHRR